MGFDLSPAALLVSELTGVNSDRWEIVESSFISNLTLRKNPNAVPAKFLIFAERGLYGAGLSNALDSGGRRKVKFVFPYRDGQTTDDLGRKAETFEINCLIFGVQYKEGLRALLRECEQPSPGVLRHPVRGDFPVAIEDVEITHQHDARRACAVRIRFIEHTFTLDTLSETAAGGPSSIKTALIAALNAVKLVNNVIAEVQSNIIAARTIANRIGSALGLYNTAYVANLQKMNKTFNPGTSTDLPTLLPVNEGGTANPNGTQASTVFPVVGTLNDPFSGFPPPPDQQLIQALATQQAIDETNRLRDSVSAIIADLESVTQFDLGETNPDLIQLNKPVGALVFREQILDLKRTASLMQNVLETGVASSAFRIIDYTVPRLMSVREVAFAAGLDADLSYQIELLNPAMLSVNYIAKGTSLKVPVPT